jgi:hypothetical protein
MILAQVDIRPSLAKSGIFSSPRYERYCTLVSVLYGTIASLAVAPKVHWRQPEKKGE